MPELYAAGIVMCINLCWSSTSSKCICLTWPDKKKLRQKLIINQKWKKATKLIASLTSLPSTSRASHRGSEKPDRRQSGVSRCRTSSRRISSTDSLQSLWCNSASLTDQVVQCQRVLTTTVWTAVFFLFFVFTPHLLPTSKGLVMKMAFCATPNMSWWCQASGTSSPCGMATCMFMVATGTAPLRIQPASQGTSLSSRRGWRWKKRPVTFPSLASCAPWMSWAWVAPWRNQIFAPQRGIIAYAVAQLQSSAVSQGCNYREAIKFEYLFKKKQNKTKCKFKTNRKNCVLLADRGNHPCS